LIGDAMRGHTAPDVAQRVQQRLAAEPTVLAPRAAEPRRRRAAWYALSMAASVAAVALVAWMALPQFDLGRDAGPALTARAPEPQAVAVPVAQGVTDYLLAHQRFSPSLAIGGIAPYIRTVAEENGTR
jgi:sigma-E factor negative regulatory protein RseA